MSEKIANAALMIGDRMWTARRHYECIAAASAEGFECNTPQARQGFVTTEGRFVGRLEALHIAVKAGQVERGKTINSKHLFSEDLY